VIGRKNEIERVIQKGLRPKYEAHHKEATLYPET
jgi:hypothetical protein